MVLSVGFTRKDLPETLKYEENRKQYRRFYFCCEDFSFAVCCVPTQYRHKDFIKEHAFFGVK